MTMLFRKKSFNQTEFSQVVPLIESPATPRPTQPETNATKKKNSNLKLFLAILGAVLVLIFLVLFVLSLLPKESQQPTTNKPTPTPKPAQLDGGLVSKLKELKTELELNDPTEDELYFPNVERKLYLDPPKK